AVDRWRLAGVDEAALQRLSAADVRIADLAPGYLGLALGSTVYIDVDAAGHGWFIDATPGADEEFGDGAASPEAGSRVDLLTAVMHELGHVLGLEDAHGDGHDDELMAELLETGVRHTPALQAVDRVFGADWN